MRFTRLTDAQRLEFEQNGYLIVPNALSPAMVERLTAAVDRLSEAGVRKDGLNKAGAFELRNAVAHDDAVLELLDWPATVPLAVQLLGWDVQLDTSHIIVRPPTRPAPAPASRRAAGIATAASRRWNCRSRYPGCA